MKPAHEGTTAESIASNVAVATCSARPSRVPKLILRVRSCTAPSHRLFSTCELVL